MNTYLIVIGKTGTGYSAQSPDVLGCTAVGETVEEVVANMEQALAQHFEGLVEDGATIPKPGGLAAYRHVMNDVGVLLAHVQIDTSRFTAPVGRS
jgi:predicted RNase H-like HicB family nuclease